MGEESDGGRVCCDVAFGQINVIVVCFTDRSDGSLEVLVAKGKFFSVLARLVGFEVKDQLLDLTNL